MAETVGRTPALAALKPETGKEMHISSDHVGVQRPIALLDPLQELCPSLDAVQALCLRSVDSIPGGEPFRRSRIDKAVLKAASSGDVELLSWACYVQSQRYSNACPEAAAFKGFEWSHLRDEEGTGPVVLAASSGHVEAVRLLVRNGAEVDERDASGWTPLMWAINNGNLPLVSFLLSHGADSETKTTKGLTCEDFILSAATSVSEASPSPSAPGSGLSPAFGSEPLKNVASDRQLIGDLIFEHQQTRQAERDAQQLDPAEVQKRMRGLSLSSNISDSSGFGAGPSGSQSSAPLSTSGHSRTSSATMRRLVGRAERTQIAEVELRARELAEGRRRALLDVAVMLEVEYQDLLGEVPTLSNSTDRSARRSKDKLVYSGLASGCGAVEVGADPLCNDFDFASVRPDQMLVFGQSHIEVIMDLIVSRAKPSRAPWIVRSRPANVLYLCLRFANSLGDEDLQEELVFAFINAVEASLYAHPTKLTHLVFWMHNAVLLLHYVQRDETMNRLDSAHEYRGLLAELVNEVYIFIVRDVERRIDKILGMAILDHESIPCFEEVRYEDEWSFMKTIRGSVKGLGGSGSGSGSVASSPAGTIRRPLSQIFGGEQVGSPRAGNASSPNGKARAAVMSPAAVLSFSPPLTSTLPRSSKQARRAEGLTQEAATAAALLAQPSPRTITSLLTSVLHVLQLYEINPSIIVQALSQVFFWVGCEVFNRILSHKRYLCKNKAMQIRLNVSMLEDWVKTNALPLTLISHHFAKVNQLISWVLCQSSLRDFDGLIATLQGLKALNPLQLKQVFSEYRYEVGEAHMDAECVQYLDQLQLDWERGRAAELSRSRTLVATHSHARSGTATQDDPEGVNKSQLDDGFDVEMREDSVFEQQSRTSSPERTNEYEDTLGSESKQSNTTATAATDADVAATEMQKAIDSLFLPGQSMNDYVPRLAPSLQDNVGRESVADVRIPNRDLLLNSRDMLPFTLPSQAEVLVVSPGDAFGFGRGHFMGTGTPSLKSMRTDSLVPSPSLGGSRVGIPSTLGGGGSGSRPASRSSSPIKAGREVGLGLNMTGSALPSTSDGIADEALSVASSSQRSNITLSSTASSSLFPQGKGLAAGASWQPVPLLPDGTLEALTAAMAQVTSGTRRR